MQLLARPPRLISYFHFALIAAFCAGLLYLIQIGLFVIAEQQHPWITGDWLINYGAGFTRRGLSGEIMFSLARVTGSNPATAVAVVQIALYAAFFGALLTSLFRKSIGLPLLLICLSPATLLFPVLDVAALGRKEVITFSFFAIFVLLLRVPARHPNVRVGVFCALAIVATLMHEMFAFYAPYFVLAELMLRPPAAPRRWPLASLAIVAAAGVVVAILALVGARIDGDAVCAKLIANGLSPDSCKGAMYWAPRSLGAEITHTLEVTRQSNYVTVYSRGALLALLPVLVASLTVDEIRRKLRTLVAGVGVCLLWSVPLFLTAVDWGRFLSVHFVLLMLLVVALVPRADAVPERAEVPLTTRAGAIATYVVVFFVTLLAGAFWSIPHCCRSSLGDGVIGLFLGP